MKFLLIVLICVGLFSIIVSNLHSYNAISDLGLGQKDERKLSFEYLPSGTSGTSGTFIIGTSPNGHLYSFDYTSGSFNEDDIQLFDLGMVFPNNTGLPMHIWTLEKDSTGKIYGGTSGAYDTCCIFIYDPTDSSIVNIPLGQYGISYVWDSTISGNYIYFGTYPNASLIRIDLTDPLHNIEVLFDSHDNNNVPDLPFSSLNYPSVNTFLDDTISDYEGEEYIRSLTTTSNGDVICGTEHGFLFSYDPDTGTINNHINVLDELGLNPNKFIYYLVSDGSNIYGGISNSDDIGTFKISSNFSSRISKLYHSPFTGAYLPTGIMNINNGFLYVAGYKYNLINNDCIDNGFFTRKIINNNELISIYHNDYDLRFARKVIGSTDHYSNLIVPTYSPGIISGGAPILSMAANNNDVYGGVYFNGRFLKHDQSLDAINHSVDDIGPFGDANCDSMIEFESDMYLGLYPTCSIRRYDTIIEEFDTSVDLKTDGINNNGPHTINENNKRVNCMTVDSTNRIIYSGTGPMTPSTADGEPWVISYDLDTDEVTHLFQADNTWRVRDIEFINSHLIISATGSDENPDKLIFHDLNSGDTYNYDLMCSSIAVKNNDVYIASYTGQFIRKYSINDLISNDGFLGTTFINYHIGENITHLIIGNDDLLYFTYFNNLGYISNGGEIIDIGALDSWNTSYNDIRSLAKSKDTTNKNIYIGSMDGHMYVFNWEEYSNKSINDNVISNFKDRNGIYLNFISYDGYNLDTGYLCGNTSGLIAISGDFDRDRYDEVIYHFDNDATVYYSDSGLINPSSDLIVYDGIEIIQKWITGDFNGDGRDQILYKKSSSNTIYSTEGSPIDESNLWMDCSKIAYSGNNIVQDWIVGDFDGDNVDEVMQKYSNSNDIYLDKQQSTPNWMHQGLVFSSTSNTIENWLVGDFDGDNIDEVLQKYANNSFIYSSDGEYYYNQQGIYWWLGRGHVYHGTSHIENWITGDFDADSCDEVLQNYDGDLIYYTENDFYYNFIPPNLYWLGRGWVYIEDEKIEKWVVGDFDGDNMDEVLQKYIGDNTIYHSEGEPSYTLNNMLHDNAASSNRFVLNNWIVGKFEGNDSGRESNSGKFDSINDTQSIPVLFNNYPNPFNPSTIISYSIPNDSNVSIVIFNVKGQKVKTLVNEQVSKGKHDQVWNGFNDEGNKVSSGIYFYKLDVNGKTKSTKKCLLLK